MAISSVSNQVPAASSQPPAAKAPQPPVDAAPAPPQDLLVSQPHDGLIHKILSPFPKHEKPYVEGSDGFVALGPNGQVTGGRAPGAIVRTVDSHHMEPGAFAQLLGHGTSSDVDFSDNDLLDVSGSKVQLTLPQTQTALGAINPSKGGLVHVPVSANPGGTADASVLALPANYNGPILISDIDDTLRWTSDEKLATGQVQPPIDGIKNIFDQAAGMGVPIVYLSAGSSLLHGDNKAFLQQLPDGILLDRDKLGIKDFDPSNNVQTQQQANYKEGVIKELEQTYPDAQFFGIGDDKVGDDIAYSSTNVQPYIHNVRTTPEHIIGTPAAITNDYTPAFGNVLLGNLSDAIKRSTTPLAPAPAPPSA